MNRDTKKLYLISLLIFAVLLASFLIKIEISRWIVAAALVPLTVITCLGIRKRSAKQIQKKEVLLISILLAVLYAALMQMTGFFFEFYKNPYFVSTKVLLERIIPMAAIIVTTEIIRGVMLSQKNKGVSIITYASCVLAEALMVSNVAGITDFDRFMNLVGIALVPAFSANIYYHYVSKRYGMMPNIAFRLITTLYIYFFPMVTGMSDAMTSCIKLIFPIVMLGLISSMFEKKKKNAVQKGKALQAISMALTIAIVISVAMVISCQFRIGALVIATESMTGEINKGDIVLYERFDHQRIEEGTVIVFLSHETKVVHRVVKIENVGGEVRYYTKGDANDTVDSGYRLASDIVGVSDLKLAYLGFPTLWIREMIEK